MIVPSSFALEGEGTSYTAQKLALEDKIRDLNGKIEELNFQILQLQDQLQKSMKDNELRFYNLETKASRLDPSPPSANATKKPKELLSSESQNIAGKIGTTATGIATARASASVIPLQQQAGEKKTFSSASSPNLGTVVFDGNGNVVAGSVGDSSSVSLDPYSIVSKDDKAVVNRDDPDIAVILALKDPEELYRRSYNFILSGRYSMAEYGFHQYIEKFITHRRAPDAYFWLGEALLAQSKYQGAAEIFLAANKKYPKSLKSPDILFKLGVSLGGLGQNDVACATFEEITKRHSGLSSAFNERLKKQRALLGC